MINIVLICAGGMSTSILMNKMKEAAAKQGIDVTVTAMAESAFLNYKGPTDVLLMGPQVSFMYDTYSKKYGPKGIKIAKIPILDYGQMNGEKVLQLALDTYGDKAQGGGK